MKKTFKILTVTAVFVCYCFGMGAASSNVAHAALSDFIMSDFYGAYYLGGTQSSGNLFYFKSIYDSNFRGEYPETTKVACSNLNPEKSTYTSGIIGDNIWLQYDKWSMLTGNTYSPQDNEITIVGYLYRYSLRVGTNNTYVRLIEF